mmetsp:Transcript_15271/g.45748  ORF Transcript_15271/g.45748 Transcript_15271/m.45748 type:complete len:234 (-) Transcript_15271:623-1324(-)
MKIVSGAQRPQVARHESAYFLQRESVRLATQLHSRVLSLISLNDVASEHSGADVGGDVSCPGSSHVPHVALHSSAAVPRPQRMAILLGRSATHAQVLVALLPSCHDVESEHPGSAAGGSSVGHVPHVAGHSAAALPLPQRVATLVRATHEQSLVASPPLPVSRPRFQNVESAHDARRRELGPSLAAARGVEATARPAVDASHRSAGRIKAKTIMAIAVARSLGSKTCALVASS